MGGSAEWQARPGRWAGKADVQEAPRRPPVAKWPGAGPWAQGGPGLQRRHGGNSATPGPDACAAGTRGRRPAGRSQKRG